MRSMIGKKPEFEPEIFIKPKEKKQSHFSFNLKITIFKITEYVKFRLLTVITPTVLIPCVIV